MHPRIIIVRILRFLKLNKVVSKVYYNYFHGFSSAGRELPAVIEKCFDKGIETGIMAKGDYYEFGIFKGHTFAHACNYGKKRNLKGIRYFGFDSFKGLPKITGLDKTEQEVFYEGQYEAPKDQVLRDIKNAGVDINSIFLIEGFFNESLNETTKQSYKMNEIAIALIDCDLHSSTVDVLNFIKFMIRNDSILIFDDYNSYSAYDSNAELGQKRALNDFLKENNQIQCEEWFNYGAYGKVFFVRLMKS